MKIDAVLPLTLRDAERAELLFDSLAQNFSGLRRIWVVSPDAQKAELTARYRRRQQPFELCVESELNIVPEFALMPKVSGWFRQQLIKLAIHERIESNLYLTFDADVVCARAVSSEQLAGNGRGACFLVPRDGFRHWYDRVESVLRIRIPLSGKMHNVTPALFHRGAVQELRRALEDKVGRGEYSRGVRGLKQRWLLYRAFKKSSYAAWRVYLLGARPWTEYALYYSFLETSGRFDLYHFYADYCLYDIASSLWVASNAELPRDWDPSPAFMGQGPPWFLVAQSNTGISAGAIRDKLAPLLQGRNTAS